MEDIRDKREASARFVESLELSVRAANCLKNAGVTCWEDVEKQGRDYWLAQPNFGRKSLEDLEAEMKVHGREFATSDKLKCELHTIATRDLVMELARRFRSG